MVNRPPYFPAKWAKDLVIPDTSTTSRTIKIGDRDGWICQLCKRPIEYISDSNCDHIKPTKLGGNGSHKNLQIAHKKCNSIKGHKTNLPPEYFINYVSTAKTKRDKNRSYTKKMRANGVAKVEPNDFHKNHVSELWNEIVHNQFQNLSYEMFKEAFDKYAAVQIKLFKDKILSTKSQ